MPSRKITVTLELTIRDMTQSEWDDAMEGAVEDDGEETKGPDGWVEELEGDELSVSIEGALESRDNPEMFAGSGLFIVTENALVTSLVLHPVEA